MLLPLVTLDPFFVFFVGSNNGCGTSPALYLQEDPICGVQLLNQNELRAPTAEKAAFYLDAAIATRLTKGKNGEFFD